MDADILSAVLVAFIGGGGFGGILMYLIKRSDRVADLEKKNDRQADGIEALSRSMLILVDVLHDKGLINGESEKVREQLQSYLFKCTTNGYYTHKEE